MLKTYWKIMDSAKCPECESLMFDDDKPLCMSVRGGRVSPPWEIMGVCPLFSQKSSLNSDEKKYNFYTVQLYLKGLAKKQEGCNE